MPDFSQRSYQKELLDRDDIPFEDIKQNMKELDFINTYLGGHQITITGLQLFLRKTTAQQITICEIGCGGGDNLSAIRKWCSRKNIAVKLIGIDINPNCIAYAKSRKENTGIKFITSDYRSVHFTEKPDILFSSLFCHHFTDEELQQQFVWMKEQAKLGSFVNDLHRHFLAYHSIKILSRIFSKSYLVKNDAPLSVLRGFSKEELQNILQKAAVHSVQLNWKWAFRWLLIFHNE
ncbi:MAG: methyltransferase domain-containing protein [Chitinophagaceae bacterium]|nr:methyltransferase domain-containing protein [Chitinophagaceae bacterium]